MVGRAAPDKQEDLRLPDSGASDAPRGSDVLPPSDPPLVRDGHRSPLWMVTREPLLNQLVGYLTEMRSRIEEAPAGPHTLAFSRSHLEDVRAAFARMIRSGESRLHAFCALLSDALLPEGYELESVVVGEVERTGERFVLNLPLSRDELLALTDLDLGNRQLQKLRYHDGAEFRRALLVANFVEYQPFDVGPQGVFKLSSRIKAEEEIWNKVVDEIFDLDAIVRRDKQLRELSRYVKDVFGLKVIAAEGRSVQRVHRALMDLALSDVDLVAHGIPPGERNRRLEFVEVKDYLSPNDRKSSGWSALKSVVRWAEMTIEIQVQPLRNYLLEREKLTRESHAGFKSRREELRDRVTRGMPLFGFYRDLLQWLFRTPDEEAPTFPGVVIDLKD
jgi:hypothetical protein